LDRTDKISRSRGGNKEVVTKKRRRSGRAEGKRAGAKVLSATLEGKKDVDFGEE